ncbi:uncharacterized protein V6R79_004793 [Siganus canaliculatus]
MVPRGLRLLTDAKRVMVSPSDSAHRCVQSERDERACRLHSGIDDDVPVTMCCRVNSMESEQKVCPRQEAPICLYYFSVILQSPPTDPCVEAAALASAVFDRQLVFMLCADRRLRSNHSSAADGAEWAADEFSWWPDKRKAPLQLRL